MRFTFNNKEYELAELKEPNKNETFDIIAIFEIVYKICDNNNWTIVSKEEFDANEDNFEDLKFINYFYGVDDEERMKEIAISIIKENK